MKIDGTYYDGAQNDDQTPNVPFDAPGYPLGPYNPMGMSSPIAGTYSMGAGTTDTQTDDRVPYQQQPSDAVPQETKFTSVNGIMVFGRGTE